jgi:hypothetical protein
MTEVPRSDNGRFLPGNHYSQMTQFKPGERPSKETEFKQGEHRSVATEFKPGEKRGPLPESIKRKLSERFSGAGNPQFGKTSPMKGKHHSLETKQKIGAKSKGHIMSIQTRIALLNANIGNTHTRGVTPFNKGKTFEELYGIEIANEKKQKMAKHWKAYFSNKHPWNYIDGKTDAILFWGMKQRDYFKLRYSILERDNYQCQSCGCCSESRLVIHHILPRNPFFGFDIINEDFNLLTLCRRCHRKIEVAMIKLLNNGENPLEYIWEAI